MKKLLRWALLLSVSAGVHATGNPEAGKEKSVVCAACHGEQGLSANKQWPNLAGQHAPYLLKQLQDFKQGKERNNPVMTAIIANLSPQDFEDLAAYYAKLPLPTEPGAVKGTDKGRVLYRSGDFSKHIAACIACHGPDGSGNDQAGFPRLAGQNSAYLQEALRAFQTGSRTNDLHGIMRSTCGKMSAEDMKAVADYLQGLINH